MERSWVSLDVRAPGIADADAQGCVLVWHEYSGAMVYHIENIHRNCYITHWMRLPSGPKGAGSDVSKGREGAAGGDHKEMPGLLERDAHGGDALPGEELPAARLPAVSERDGEGERDEEEPAVRVRGIGGAGMTKPVIKYHSRVESGNIYALLAKCSAELLKMHRISEYNELRDRVCAEKSYKGALSVLGEVFELKDLDGVY